MRRARRARLRRTRRAGMPRFVGSGFRSLPARAVRAADLTPEFARYQPGRCGGAPWQGRTSLAGISGNVRRAPCVGLSVRSRRAVRELRATSLAGAPRLARTVAAARPGRESRATSLAGAPRLARTVAAARPGLQSRATSLAGAPRPARTFAAVRHDPLARPPARASGLSRLRYDRGRALQPDANASHATTARRAPRAARRPRRSPSMFRSRG